MKKFAGFTPQQEYMLLSKMGYTGPFNKAEMEKFISSSPNAATQLGHWSEVAKKRVEKKEFAEGGVVPPEVQKLNEAQAKYAAANSANTTNPTDATGTALSEATAELAAAQSAQQTTGVPSSSEAIQTAIETPGNIVTPANVSKITEQSNQIIEDDTGRQGEVDEVQTSTVTDPSLAQAADKTEANTYDASTIQDKVAGATDNLEAATADPSAKATVRGQLEELMSDFEGGGTPPWASGAMRQAMGVMQQRGLGASSMAGQAVVQAAMESALGIARSDAATYAQFEMQNLNNEQQVNIFKTQQTIAGMFSDQAADNAAKQFNAASQNQTDQFFADLQTTVSRFNAEQVNAIQKFNAGEENAVAQFNSSLKAQRDQFNANNDLIIAQANAKWRQDIATTNSEAQNEANLQFALNANNLTQRALDQIWQRERDIMNFSFAASESQKERDLSILLANKSISASRKQLDQQISADRKNSRNAAIGAIAGEIFGSIF